jgi:hypothetical protein
MQMHVLPGQEQTVTSQDSTKDPVFEFARRTGGDLFGVTFDLAATSEEARAANDVLDEIEAEEVASDIASRLRRMGHAL